MGIDMHTYGSGIRVTVSEDELVRASRGYLLSDEGLTRVREMYRPADESVIDRGHTLETLFSAFRQLLVRSSATGEVTGCFGYDDRYYDPSPLWDSLQTGLAPGSWLAYTWDQAEEFHAKVLVIEPGGEGVAMVVTPPTRVMDIHEFVSDLVDRDVLPAVQRPELSFPVMSEMLDRGQAWLA